MAQTIVAAARAAAEYRDIHLAACRYRAQGLVCSTCSDLSERAERAIKRAGAYIADVEDGLEPDPAEELVTIGLEGWWVRVDDDAELIAA